jgi:hypothetical protein
MGIVFSCGPPNLGNVIRDARDPGEVDAAISEEPRSSGTGIA